MSEDEMLASLAYLKWKLRAGSALELAEHLATDTENNFAAFGKQDRSGTASESFQATQAEDLIRLVSCVGFFLPAVFGMPVCMQPQHNWARCSICDAAKQLMQNKKTFRSPT